MPPKRTQKKSPTKSQTPVKEVNLSLTIEHFADHLIESYGLYDSKFINLNAFRTQIKKILTKHLGAKLTAPFVTELIDGVYQEYNPDDLEEFNDQVFQMVLDELSENQPEKLIVIVEDLDELFYPSKSYPDFLEDWEYYVKILTDTLIFLFNLEKERGNSQLEDVEYQYYKGLEL